MRKEVCTVSDAWVIWLRFLSHLLESWQSTLEYSPLAWTLCRFPNFVYYNNASESKYSQCFCLWWLIKSLVMRVHFYKQMFINIGLLQVIEFRYVRNHNNCIMYRENVFLPERKLLQKAGKGPQRNKEKATMKNVRKEPYWKGGKQHSLWCDLNHIWVLHGRLFTVGLSFWVEGRGSTWDSIQDHLGR